MSIFLEGWKSSTFSFIFHGRENFRELYEVTEEMMDVVKSYAVNGRDAQHPEGVRFAAIYLMYALFFKQPCRPTVKIRLVLDEFKEIQILIEAAKMNKHIDVVFAWAKLFNAGAFHFTATSIQMGFETAFKMEQKEMKEEKKKKKPTDWFEDREFKDKMKNIERNYEYYQKVKERLIEQKPETKRMFTFRPNDNITEAVKKIVNTDVAQDGVIKDGIGDRRRALKEEFYSTGTVESHRDRLFADGRMKADLEMKNEPGANGGVSGEDDEWAPITKKGRKYTRKTGKKGRPKGRGLGKKNRRAAFGRKVTDADGVGMMGNLAIVEDEGKKKGVGRGRKRSRAKETTPENLGDGLSSDEDEEKLTPDIEVKGKGRGRGKGRGGKRNRVGKRQQVEELVNVDEESSININMEPKDIVEENGAGEYLKKDPVEEYVNIEKEFVDEEDNLIDNLEDEFVDEEDRFKEDPVEEHLNFEEDPMEVEDSIYMEDDDSPVASPRICLCDSTQWTCAKPICGIDKCTSCGECNGVKCGEPTCDFCTDNPEDGSGRFCKRH